VDGLIGASRPESRGAFIREMGFGPHPLKKNMKTKQSPKKNIFKELKINSL